MIPQIHQTVLLKTINPWSYELFLSFLWDFLQRILQESFQRFLLKNYFREFLLSFLTNSSKENVKKSCPVFLKIPFSKFFRDFSLNCFGNSRNCIFYSDPFFNISFILKTPPGIHPKIPSSIPPKIPPRRPPEVPANIHVRIFTKFLLEVPSGFFGLFTLGTHPKILSKTPPQVL